MQQRRKLIDDLYERKGFDQKRNISAEKLKSLTTSAVDLLTDFVNDKVEYDVDLLTHDNNYDEVTVSNDTIKAELAVDVDQTIKSVESVESQMPKVEEQPPKKSKRFTKKVH